MSRQVDERVVSMKFDNAHFEKNVSTTMSTLDKLKQKLRLTESTKGLENISSASKKVDMSTLGNGVEAVRVKFSALQVMGVTALTNITNSAVNAGKRMVDALTLKPIRTGFQEYETQMNAVQTIMANVGHKGKTLEDVNNALDELNKYADLTIYNFTEMTRNIGLFTNAGVDLDKSVAAIKGFSNAAAMAGTNATDTSRAMYQLSQAMSAGTVKLMDWKSLETANITGERFQETVKETAKVHGINVDAMIAKEGSFRETLKDGWLTADLMSEALNHYTLSRETMTEAEQEAAKVQMLSIGYSEEQIEKLFDLGTEANNAATKIKTFSQLWDALQETAQSGWSQTWRLIVGDFEQAKGMLTPLFNFLSGIIDSISTARNKLLEGAMNNPLADLVKKIDNTTKSVSKAVETVKNYDKVVDEIINGKWGNGKTRFDKLTKAGYDWAHAQNLVNEKLGDSTRHNTKYKESQEKLQKTQEYTLDQLAEMSDAQLKQAGYSKDQIDALRELGKAADKANMPLSKFVETIKDKKDGRSLLIEGFTTIGKSITAIASAIGKAWKQIFPPMTSLELYGLIRGFNEFTQHLKISKDTVENITRTFKGLFAALDIILTIVGGPIKFVLKTIFKLLGKADVDILSVTANIGDAIVVLRDWIDENNIFVKGLKAVLPYLAKVADAIAFWIDGAKDAEDVPKYIVEGLVNGLKNGVKTVVNVVKNLGKAMIDGICEVLGIHSPSVEFFKIGQYVILGFINGFKEGTGKAIDVVRNFGLKVFEVLKNVASVVWPVIKNIFFGIVDLIKNLDFGSLIAIAVSGGFIFGIKKVGDTLDKLLGPLEGVTKILEGAGHVLTSIGNIGNAFAKYIRAQAWLKTSKAVLNLAIGISILVASLIALTYVESDKLWDAVNVLGALAGIMLVLSVAAGVVGKIDSLGKSSMSLVSVAASLLFLTFVMKQLSTIEDEDIPKVLYMLTAIIGGLSLLAIVLGKFVTADSAKSMNKAGLMLIKIAGALWIMTKVIKIIAGLEDSEIQKGIFVIGVLEAMFLAMVITFGIIGQRGSAVTKAGGMLLLMAVALGITVGVIKLLAKTSSSDIGRGLAVITAIGSIFAALVMVSKFAGQYGTKAGMMLLMMSFALINVTYVMKTIAKMDDSAIKKGLGVIAVLELLFAAVIACSHLAGQNAVKAGVMLLLMSAALLIVVGVIAIIGLMKPDNLKRGLACVALLEVLFAGLIAVTNLSKGCEKELKMMVIAIGVLAGAVLILSFLDPKKLAGATAAISAVTLSFAALVASTKYAKNSKSMRKTLIMMLGVVLVLAGVVAALSLLKPHSVLTTATALSELLIAFSASMAILGKTGRISKTVNKSMPMLLGVVLGLAGILGVMSKLGVEGSIQSATAISILLESMAAALVILGRTGRISTTVSKVLPILLGVVAGLALILGLMSGFNVEASIPSAIALGILLNAMAAAMVILGRTGRISTTVNKVLPVLLGVVAGLALILGLMSAFNVEASIPSAIALGILLNAMSAALLIVSKVSPTASAAMPAMLLMGVVVAELAVILGIMSKLNIEVSIPTAIALGILLNAMSAALLILGAAAPVAVEAIAGVTALIAVVAEIGLFVGAIGALVTKFPQLEKFLDKGLPVIEKIGSAIGKFFGGIVKGFTESATAGLPKAATNLSKFMENLQPFIDGASKIDKAVTETISALAKAIITITAADVVNGLTSWITGGNSIENFGKDLGKLGPALGKFAKGVKDLTPDTLLKTKIAADTVKALAEAAKNIPNDGGLIGKIVGDNNLGEFAKCISSVGKHLNNLVNELGEDFGRKQLKVIKNGCDAVTLLAEAAERIPNTGGLLAAITGDNDIGQFALALAGIGSNLRVFIDGLGEFGEKELERFKYGAKAIQEMANIKIENTGGLAGIFAGDNNLGVFALELAGVGTNIKAFIESIGTFGEAELTTFTTTSAAVQKMANLASNVKGLKLGDSIFSTGLVDFAATLPNIGENVKEFTDKAGNVKQSKADNAIGVVNSLAKIATIKDFSQTNKNIKTFGSAIKTLADKICSFAITMNGIAEDTLTAGVNKIKAFVSSIKGIDTSATESLEKLVKSLENAGKKGIKKFTDSFTDVTATADVKKAASKMMSNFALGLKNEDKVSTIKSNAKSLASKAANAIKTEEMKKKFYTAGSYLVSGFCNGISNNDYKAAAKARAMAAKAAEAAKKELDEHSPSRVFYEIGDFAGLGFVNALDDYGDKSYRAGSEIANSARSGLSKAISKVTDLIEGNVDSQPTIRPVLDLSAVSAGAGTINDLLNMNPSVGVLSNLGAINSMMSKGQNGSTNDVISAINRLGKSISGMSNTTYNVNGVTYDDGSNIANAVQALTRAATIERRI